MAKNNKLFSQLRALICNSDLDVLDRFKLCVTAYHMASK